MVDAVQNNPVSYGDEFGSLLDGPWLLGEQLDHNRSVALARPRIIEGHQETHHPIRPRAFHLYSRRCHIMADLSVHSKLRFSYRIMKQSIFRSGLRGRMGGFLVGDEAPGLTRLRTSMWPAIRRVGLGSTIGRCSYRFETG